MNHPSETELLLLAYGEAARAGELDSHMTVCETCRTTLEEIERGRVALDLTIPVRRRQRARADWAAVALAAAAIFAAVLVTRPRPMRDAGLHWRPTTTWSMTAGYVTGGSAMNDIDAQLTRLERERYYGLPN
jgi:hypothetical protein